MPQQARVVVSLVAVALLTATAFLVFRPAPSVNEEGAEVRIETRARTAAGAQDGGAWTKTRPASPAPIGWTDETVVGKFNDWEPAFAADPNGPYLYMLTTRYGAKKTCTTCRHSGLALTRSVDNGATWEPWTWLFDPTGTMGGWQADPQILVDETGVVHALLLMAPYTTKYTRSTDHGATWSAPVEIIGTELTWVDHPWLAVSPDGMDVYVGFNHHQNWQTTSNDGGLTWAEPIQVSDPAEDDYTFANGATVLADTETALFTSTDFGCCPYADFAHKRPIEVWVTRSADHGATWTQTAVDIMAAPPACTLEKCPKAYWGAYSSIASDADGDAMLVYSGGHTKYGAVQMWFSTSSDDGLTWSTPATLSVPTMGGGYPIVVGSGDGNFRVTWVDDLKGKPDSPALNIWYRETFDHGATWTSKVRLSNLTGGQTYKTAKGFKFFYGDYAAMGIDYLGDTFALWPEAGSYNGPGTSWYSRQNT